MYKKTLTYTNLNGAPVTETLYFNLTTLEVAKIAADYGKDGNTDLTELIQEEVAKNNPGKIIILLAELVLKAYGRKTEDGRMDKSPETVAKFESSMAYAAFVDMLLDPTNDEATKFGQNVVTSDPLKKAAAQHPALRPVGDDPSHENNMAAELKEFLKFKEMQMKSGQ